MWWLFPRTPPGSIPITRTTGSTHLFDESLCCPLSVFCWHSREIQYFPGVYKPISRGIEDAKYVLILAITTPHFYYVYNHVRRRRLWPGRSLTSAEYLHLLRIFISLGRYEEV